MKIRVNNSCFAAVPPVRAEEAEEGQGETAGQKSCVSRAPLQPVSFQGCLFLFQAAQAENVVAFS